MRDCVSKIAVVPGRSAGAIVLGQPLPANPGLTMVFANDRLIEMVVRPE